MGELVVWTCDWVPEPPRGFVRDLRLRWACEEAGLPYTVRPVAFDDRYTNHLDDRFTAADLLMADVLRGPRVRAFGQRPATEAHVARVTSRPAFLRAQADQLAHFAAGDSRR